MSPDLTLGELARAFSISTKTARRYLKNGAFPNAYRVGDPDTGEWRIPESDLELYREVQRAKLRRRRAERNETSE